jgi:hypothetical protein
MISCEEAALICNKAQYREASLIEKFKLRWHVALCRVCNAYVKKNVKLTSLCRKASLYGLTEAEKEAIRDRISKFQG